MLALVIYNQEINHHKPYQFKTIPVYYFTISVDQEYIDKVALSLRVSPKIVLNVFSVWWSHLNAHMIRACYQALWYWQVSVLRRLLEWGPHLFAGWWLGSPSVSHDVCVSINWFRTWHLASSKPARKSSCLQDTSQDLMQSINESESQHSYWILSARSKPSYSPWTTSKEKY